MTFVSQPRRTEVTQPALESPLLPVARGAHMASNAHRNQTTHAHYEIESNTAKWLAWIINMILVAGLLSLT